MEAAPVIFIHNDPNVYESDSFFNTLDKIVSDLPISVYVYEATDYFKVADLIKKKPDSILIYDKLETIYTKLQCGYHDCYNTHFDTGYSPLRVTVAFNMITENMYESLKNAGLTEEAKKIDKLREDIFG